MVRAKLVESGVLVKVPYSDHPPRYDYLLTGAGRDLWPVLTAMRQWGDQYGRETCGDQLGHGDVAMLPRASLAQR